MLDALCSRCSGTKVSSTPPGIPTDQATFIDSSSGPWPCDLCNGNGAIESASGRWRHKETGRLVDLLPRGPAYRKLKYMNAKILTAGKGFGSNRAMLGKEIMIAEADLGTVWEKASMKLTRRQQQSQEKGRG